MLLSRSRGAAKGIEEGEGGSSMVDMVASIAESAYLGAGRGGLDAVGLQGKDIDGFSGRPLDAGGKAMGGNEFQERVAGAESHGFDELLGRGFEKRAYEAADASLRRGSGPRDQGIERE